MIDPKSTVTYAQYREDIILYALFHDIKKGFYVDVGANYATVDSVTKLFYDKGWSGINIEPIKSLHKELVKARPRDINLQCGAGSKSGEATLREYKDISGHSTFATDQKRAHSSNVTHTDYKVPIEPLKKIFSEYDVQHIHFIKIDVEGFEAEVVGGNDWKKYRPEVVCIEANHITQNWQQDLLRNEYRLFIGDGLNEYYVAQEAWHRTEDFAERAVALDYHALKQHQAQAWKQDTDLLVRMQSLIESQTSRIALLEDENRLSLKNRSLRGRLRVVAKGLTVDWIEFKRSK
jgi:FkbM family methyltransferase